MAHETDPNGDECAMSEPQWRHYVCKSLDAGEKRMSDLQDSIHANTMATTKISDALEDHKKTLDEHKESTQELVKLFGAMKGGFQVLGWIGQGLKWITVTAGSAAGFWKLVTGRWPFL